MSESNGSGPSSNGSQNGNKDGLAKQQHGGAIYQGPAKNPKPGPGRPSSELRRIARLGFEARVPELLRISKHGLREVDRLKAIDLLGKYGLGEAKGYDGELVQKLAEAVRDVFETPGPALVDNVIVATQEANPKDAIASTVRAWLDERVALLADNWKRIISTHVT